jgi:hypothetical protein
MEKKHDLIICVRVDLPMALFGMSIKALGLLVGWSGVPLPETPHIGISLFVCLNIINIVKTSTKFEPHFGLAPKLNTLVCRLVGRWSI